MSRLALPRSARPLETTAAVLAALLVAGLGRPADAHWLPSGFGANIPSRVVAFGDSITQGVAGTPCTNPSCVVDAPYPAVLRVLLSPRHPGVSVVNEGHGGERTADGLGRLASVLASDRPGFVLIMEGTNDASDQAFHGVFEPGAIADALHAMVQTVKGSGAVPILATIPPNFRTFNLGPQAESIIEAVNGMLPGIAAAEDIRLVDVFSAMHDSGLFGPDDPLHPNQAGYVVLGGAWWSAVDQALDDGLRLLPQAYLLRFDREVFRAGDTLDVDLTVKDDVTAGVVDLYLGLVLPPDAGPLIGCAVGDGLAYLADDFTRVVFACFSDPPDRAAPLMHDVLFAPPIALVTVADFWRAFFTPAYPPGTYTLFFAVTPAGDPAHTLVATWHSFTFVP